MKPFSQILFAAIAGNLLASAAWAGFTVTANLGATVSGLDRWDVRAVNTGGETGTQIKGLEYEYSGAPPAFEGAILTPFYEDPIGMDSVNLLSGSRTRVRISSSGANNVFTEIAPIAILHVPNDYLFGLTWFRGTITCSGTQQASGSGFQIARIFIPTRTSGVFSGNIGGDIGDKVPFSVDLARANPEPFPVIGPFPQTHAYYGANPSLGAPFSTQVMVTHANPNASLSLAFGPTPDESLLYDFLRDLKITGGGLGTQTFTVSGRVVSDDGRPWSGELLVPIVASDGDFRINGALRVTFSSSVPEPAHAALLLLTFACRRRSRGSVCGSDDVVQQGAVTQAVKPSVVAAFHVDAATEYRIH